MANSALVKPWGLPPTNWQNTFDQHRTGQQPYIPMKLWHQRVDFSDFSDADTNELLSLNLAFTTNAFPAPVWVVGAYINLYTVFAGGSVSAATLDLGDAGAANELMAQTDVFTGASLGNKVGKILNLQETAYVPLLELTTTTDDIDNLITGSVGVFIWYYDLPTIPQGVINQ